MNTCEHNGKIITKYIKTYKPSLPITLKDNMYWDDYTTVLICSLCNKEININK